MSQIVQSQLTHAILSGNRIEFQRPRYTDSRELETAGNVTLPFEGWSMAMHPPSNVLVVSERTESVSNVKIHIRALDTGGSHGRANSDSLSHDFGDKFSAKVLPPRISLCGKTVAVLFQTQTERKETTPREDILLDALVVWNWHTGGKLYVLDNPSYGAITLINDAWLLAGHHRFDNGGNVYTLDIMDTSAESIKKISLLFEDPTMLQLHFDWELFSCGVTYPCVACPAKGPSSCYLFYDSPSMPRVEAELWGNGTEAERAFVISISDLVNVVNNHLRNGTGEDYLTWREWQHCIRGSLGNDKAPKRSQTI